MFRICTTFFFVLISPFVQSHRTHTKKQCPMQHQVWNECGTPCPKNCSNVNLPSVFCGLGCVSGCFCHVPFVFLSEKSRVCVLRKYCKYTKH